MTYGLRFPSCSTISYYNCKVCPIDFLVDVLQDLLSSVLQLQRHFFSLLMFIVTSTRHTFQRLGRGLTYQGGRRAPMYNCHGPSLMNLSTICQLDMAWPSLWLHVYLELGKVGCKSGDVRHPAPPEVSETLYGTAHTSYGGTASLPPIVGFQE